MAKILHVCTAFVVLVCLCTFPDITHAYDGVFTYIQYWIGNDKGYLCSSCYNPNAVLGTDSYCGTDEEAENAPVGVDDVLPTYISMLNMTVSVYGAFNCNSEYDTKQQFLRLVLNGHIFDRPMGAANSDNICYCSNCARPVSFFFNSDEIANYYHMGTTNNFSVVVSYDEDYQTRFLDNAMSYRYLNTESQESSGSGSADFNTTICLSFLQVDVGYRVAEPTLTYISPTCGPISGATNISIVGTNFDPDRRMRCVFDSTTRTNATYVNEKLAYCSSPGNVQSVVTFALETEIIPMQWIEADTKAEFRFYNDPVLESVSPTSAPTKGGTLLTISGSFDVTDFGRCQFSSGDESVTVGAGFSGDRSYITCYTPQWKEDGDVNLSVSLNDQQYSRPLSFTFKDAFQLSTMHYFLIGLGSVLLVLLIVFIVVWVKHRSTLDGYERIRDGNVFVAMKDIKFGERIGRGTFGEVYKCTWRGAVVAVKKLTTTTVSEEFIQEFEKEVSLMRNLRAPNVLQFLGSSFQPPNNVCIVIEYMSRGSLYGILHNYTNVLDWSLMLRMLADTARGMTYLHTCKPPVIHRDLKSHNLLVDEFWRVKVCDFGLSTVLEHQSQTMTACGTPCWTAPEVLKHLRYTVKADVYSFAIVMWECISRVDPYMNIPPFKVIYAVAREKMRPKVPPGIPQEYVRLMKDCWAQNPDARPQFETILDRIEVMCSQNWPGQPASHLTLTENAVAGSQLVAQSPKQARRNFVVPGNAAATTAAATTTTTTTTTTTAAAAGAHDAASPEMAASPDIPPSPSPPNPSSALGMLNPPTTPSK